MTPQPYRSAGPLLRPLRRQGRHQRPPRPPFGHFPLPAPGREVRAGAAWRKQKRVGRGDGVPLFAPRSSCPPREPDGPMAFPTPLSRRKAAGRGRLKKAKNRFAPRVQGAPFCPALSVSSAGRAARWGFQRSKNAARPHGAPCGLVFFHPRTAGAAGGAFAAADRAGTDCTIWETPFCR